MTNFQFNATLSHFPSFPVRNSGNRDQNVYGTVYLFKNQRKAFRFEIKENYLRTLSLQLLFFFSQHWIDCTESAGEDLAAERLHFQPDRGVQAPPELHKHPAWIFQHGDPRAKG